MYKNMFLYEKTRRYLKNDYHFFEVENLIKFLNGKTDIEHVTFAKNLP